MDICHISSMHSIEDDRIYERACKGLAKHGHKVTLIVTAAESHQRDAVEIAAIKPRVGFSRRVWSSGQAFLIAWRIPAHVYHFHDPDLIPVMAFLRLLRRRVVYDVHENYVVRFGQWGMNGWMGSVLARLFRTAELGAARWFDGVVVTADSMSEIFRGWARRIVVVRNLHDVDTLQSLDSNLERDPVPVIYTSGTIREDRNCDALIDVLPAILELRPEVILRIAGNFAPGYKDHLQHRAAELGVDASLDLQGFLPYREHLKRTSRAHIGCVLLGRDARSSTTTKNRLFEYMAAGMPVIAEDLPEERKVVAKHNCGILVDSRNRQEVADAVLWVLDHPEAAQEMGARGRAAVLREYDFAFDLAKLEEFYRDVVQGAPREESKAEEA